MNYLNEKKETNTIRFICSAISGVSVCIFVLPFDNVKTKILRMKASNILLIKMKMESYLTKVS
jgi:hypothetical protein